MNKILRTNKKMLKTGTYTYMITLPKEWVKGLKWRSKQKLLLELKGEKIVVSSIPKLPTEPKKAAKKKK